MTAVQEIPYLLENVELLSSISKFVNNINMDTDKIICEDKKWMELAQDVSDGTAVLNLRVLVSECCFW
jgi:hypothetical protein